MRMTLNRSTALSWLVMEETPVRVVTWEDVVAALLGAVLTLRGGPGTPPVCQPSWLTGGTSRA